MLAALAPCYIFTPAKRRRRHGHFGNPGRGQRQEASDKDLSGAAKKEWRRFLVFVGVHERGHADSYYHVACDVGKDLDSMSGTGTGKN